MHARVWHRSDGSIVSVQRFLASEPDKIADALAKRKARGDLPDDVQFVDVTTEAELAALLPAEAAQSDRKRHKWRLRDGKIVVDHTLPDPPHPKQALLDAVDKANTVGEVKALLRQIVAGQ